MRLFFRNAVLIFGPIFSVIQYVPPPGSAFRSLGWLVDRVGLNGALSIPSVNKTVIEPPKDNIKIKKLRTTFTIKKSMENSPNSALIKVYNLSKNKWNALTSKNKEMRVTLFAGYLDNLTMLYSGDVTNASYAREGTDWVGTIEAGDGAMANSNAFVNVSCEENSGILNSANSILESFDKNGVNIENAKAALSEMLSDVKTAAGRVFNGSASKELEDLCQSHGHRAYVNNSELKIVPYDSPEYDKAIHLTPINGLIGSPKNLKEGVGFDTLLMPGLDVGSLVALDSAEVKGAYTVNSIEYRGDTFGSEWSCKCEGTEWYDSHAIKLYQPLDGIKVAKLVEMTINAEDYPDDYKDEYKYDKDGNFVEYTDKNFGSQSKSLGSMLDNNPDLDKFYDAEGKYIGEGL